MAARRGLLRAGTRGPACRIRFDDYVASQRLPNDIMEPTTHQSHRYNLAATSSAGSGR
jgi:hypothetical protein